VGVLEITASRFHVKLIGLIVVDELKSVTLRDRISSSRNVVSTKIIITGKEGDHRILIVAGNSDHRGGCIFSDVLLILFDLAFVINCNELDVVCAVFS